MMGYEVKSALVVGAGAIGSIVAASIHSALPGAVRILAGGERERRLRSDGLIINGKRLDIPLASTGRVGESGEEPGLVIVAVKGQHLAQAIDDIRPYVGAETLIVSLLNGISSEDELSAAFGTKHVLYAMIIGIDAVRDGNAISYTQPGTIHFGEAVNKPGGHAERVERVSRFLGKARIRYEVPERMIRTMWYKFMINVGINQASAVLRAPYGAFQKVPEAQHVMESAMFEVIALSKALGTGLLEEDLHSWYKTLGSLAPEGKTSMLQDVEAGRKTEVELFSGTVIRLGIETGIPVPVNRMLYDLIHAIEQSYSLTT
jgi:2-dehydropantoate 2-reductase